MTKVTLMRLTAIKDGKTIGDFVMCRKHANAAMYDYHALEGNVSVIREPLVDDVSDYVEGDRCEVCEDEQ